MLGGCGIDEMVVKKDGMVYIPYHIIYHERGDVPCQILLRGIRHRQRGHRHHRFCPFSWTLAKVDCPFCMYGSCIARSCVQIVTPKDLPSGVVPVLAEGHENYDTGGWERASNNGSDTPEHAKQNA